MTRVRVQVPQRFAQPLSACPLREVVAENMRAEHVLEARRLPRLEVLRLSGHLGNYNSMVAAVNTLRADKPHLRVAGLEDGLFNNWGPGVHRALALSMLRPHRPSQPPPPRPAARHSAGSTPRDRDSTHQERHAE